MSASAGLTLMDFTAYDLPTEKWMKLIRPRMRLRIRVRNRTFVSSVVKVGDRSSDEPLDTSGVQWHWNSNEERLSRPSFADDERFDVEIERRYWLRYTCIRRTKPVTIDQIRTGDYCALSLYDRQEFSEVHEDSTRIVVGEIRFTLQNDVSSEDALSGKSSTYA